MSEVDGAIVKPSQIGHNRCWPAGQAHFFGTFCIQDQPGVNEREKRGKGIMFAPSNIDIIVINIFTDILSNITAIY